MRLWFQENAPLLEVRFSLLWYTVGTMSYPAQIWCTLVLGLGIAVAHAWLVTFALYWYLPWVDIPMHFFGGVWLVCLLATAHWLRLIPSAWVYRRRNVLFITLCMMVGWEVFGVWLEQGFKAGWLIDTTFDVLFGILGVMIGYWRLSKHTHE